MKILVYLGVGLILRTFFVDHLQNGWRWSVREITTGPSGETVVTQVGRWTPIDIGCCLIIVYLMYVSARATIRFLQKRSQRPSE